MEVNYDKFMFKFTINLFDDLSNKLIKDFEEAISNDLNIKYKLKRFEQFYGEKIDEVEFNKNFEIENPELDKEQKNKINQGILFSIISSFVCE